MELVRPGRLSVAVEGIVAASAGSIAISSISVSSVRVKYYNALGFAFMIGGARWQTKDRIIEMKLDFGVEARDDGVAVGMPSMETAVLVVGKQLVTLDASSPLVVASHDHPSRQARVGKPELVLGDKPVRVEGRV